MMMMPVYPGAPWLPKFSGLKSDIKYGDWKEQMFGLLNAQDLTELRKVGLLMGALAGEAKLQASVLDTGERDTSVKLFAFLDSLYGDNTPIAVVRSKFFSCVQKPDESLTSFALRLRELHCRLRRHNPDDAPSESALKDQMLLGLSEGPLSQTMRTYARRNPELDFAAIYSEALLLEEEQQGQRGIDATCSATFGESRQHSTPISNWKETLKQEILTEVKDQMKGLTHEIMSEIKPLLHYSERKYTPRHHGPTTRPRVRIQGNEWTRDGRPICRQCRQVGHMARSCQAAGVSNTQALN